MQATLNRSASHIYMLIHLNVDVTMMVKTRGAMNLEGAGIEEIGGK